MSEFHHPYNFIPVTGKVNNKKTETVEYAEIKAGNTEIRHDLWKSGTHSGRIIVQVHLKTPTVVGGQQIAAETAEGSSTVQAFQRETNTAAIPANSLRGVIGNLAESLSQSALRVLEKKKYSVRKSVGQALPAIGLLCEYPEHPQKFKLLPMALLSFKSNKDIWLDIFGGVTPAKYRVPASIKAYVSNHNHLTVIPDSYLGQHRDLQSYHETARKEFFFAKLPQSNEVKLRDKAIANDPVLSQTVTELITEAEYIKLPNREKKDYTRGILHILGIKGREADIPQTKKQEFFIPYPNPTSINSPAPKKLPIPDNVIENFVTLAAERNAEDKNLPFLPVNYEKWKPEVGQLVYFDVRRNQENAIEVSEISFSAIWRKLLNGDSHEFFGNIDADLLPWNPLRTHLTPAECLFGVVENAKDGDEKQARALASRVRFSDAQATKTVIFDELVTLKILSSPKLPSPAMYFHQKMKPQGTHIKKTALNLGEHEPNGRKVYLHHQADAIEQKFWKTKKLNESLKQKMRCTPMQKEQNFYFHIDFDNLSTDELNLLIRSVHPDPDFQHRLGLGKALGLGSVKMDVMGVFLIDRTKRYSLEGFYEMARYHRVFKGTAKNHTEAWKILYPTEYAMLEGAADLLTSEFYTEGKLIDKKTLDLLKTVGNPAKLKTEVAVLPPLMTTQKDVESETFQWFVKNEKSKAPQALPGIEEDKPLPVLHTNL